MILSTYTNYIDLY
uniref:Uncharacterized protein n=1 Tax=Rhizophora mucronata TaxID=61149 RepID=A0A2P2QC23_RHIMU